MELEKTDIALTFDADRERERQEREEKIKREILEKQVRLVQRGGRGGGAGGDEAEEVVMGVVEEGLTVVGGALGDGSGDGSQGSGLVLGYGVGGGVPPQFTALVPPKLLASRKAWNLWPAELASSH